MKIKCTILILMLVLIGCVSVNKTLLNPSPTLDRDSLYISDFLHSMNTVFSIYTLQFKTL